MKKTLLAAALVAATASAQADTKLYGHVAYKAETGDQTDEDYSFGRHVFSESRFGFSFSKKAGGVKWLALQEFGIQAGENNTSNIELDESDSGQDLNGDGDTTDEVKTGETGGSQLRSRRQAFGVAGGFGKILFGQYNDVGDGVLNADLAGTALVDPMGSATTGVVSNFGSTYTVNGFDPGRGEALRYYSPKLGGIATVAGQIQEDEGYELALKLNASGFRLYAFYEDNGEENADGETAGGYATRYGLLAGYKAPFGLSITATYSNDEDDTAGGSDETEATALKIGYAIGKHKLSLKGASREFETSDREPSETVLAWNYSPAKGVNLFAAYKVGDNDVAGTDKQTGFGIGGRVKF